MDTARRPWLIGPGSDPHFPDPELADSDGLLAVGGDLSAERLLMAYEQGVFPWYDKGLPPLWWSPDPRAVLDDDELHISRSMRREIRNTSLTLTFDRAFRRVMYECGQQRENGTWILEPMLEAYTHLHNLGQAHSVEAWEGEELAGGLYGVHRGGLFAAESMFHRRTNASKLVLLSSVSTLFELGIELFDVQFLTEHLETLGAREIPRAQYLRRLARARSRAVDLSQLALEDPLAHLRRRIGAPLNKHQ
jgi:leucyl/phenylalanyl-tRNA--protein transferase